MFKAVVRDRNSKKIIFKTMICSEYYENVDGNEILEFFDGSYKEYDLKQFSIKVWKLNGAEKIVCLVSER